MANGKSSNTDFDQVGNKLADLGRLVLIRQLAQVHHVKGHCMHPWNEMSDRVAKVGAASYDKLTSKGFYGTMNCLDLDCCFLSPSTLIQYLNVNSPKLPHKALEPLCRT